MDLSRSTPGLTGPGSTVCSVVNIHPTRWELVRLFFKPSYERYVAAIVKAKSYWSVDRHEATAEYMVNVGDRATRPVNKDAAQVVLVSGGRSINLPIQC